MVATAIETNHVRGQMLHNQRSQTHLNTHVLTELEEEKRMSHSSTVGNDTTTADLHEQQCSGEYKNATWPPQQVVHRVNEEKFFLAE